ncbi:Phosphopentomutase [Arsenophonus endosymbiont of Bemisia tabaci Q2]|nr:Phosphopentomutase [Arsenophonus endosymbiont of Bemisia tabaci Q2]
MVSIGKIADIYPNVGITKQMKATGIEALFAASLEEIKKAADNTIVFTNFVDFDSSYGHRRDVAGYAAELALFDTLLPEMLALIENGDVLIITADHGCDPTWPGTDHTRENILILIYGPKVKPGKLGHLQTFSDIGQTVAQYFDLSPMAYGKTL